MSIQKLMPKLALTNAEMFGENEAFKVKYLQGSPRQYRADMSKALINVNGQTVITQPKDDFSFAPFAYRYFEEALFGKEEKVWVEFFFLNEALHVCSIMFHQYTAQAFKQHWADFLFYGDLTPCECIFTVRFEEKKAEVEENGKKVSKIYHIGSFKSKPISAETKDAFFTLVDCLPSIYREDTYKEMGRNAIKSENYKKPSSSTALEIEKQAEWRRQAGLLEDFRRRTISEPEPLPNESAQKSATKRVLGAGAKNR